MDGSWDDATLVFNATGKDKDDWRWPNKSELKKAEKAWAKTIGEREPTKAEKSRSPSPAAPEKEEKEGEGEGSATQPLALLFYAASVAVPLLYFNPEYQQQLMEVLGMAGTGGNSTAIGS